jgi:hypothetical protein
MGGKIFMQTKKKLAPSLMQSRCQPQPEFGERSYSRGN